MNGNIVLLGAGGTGMCGVAGILSELGFSDNIICIDSAQSELTDKLKNIGLKVIIGHGNYDIQIQDHIIYSEACINSPELQKAKSFTREAKKQKLILNYFQFLGEVSKYFYTIGITGTNGKSTTTALALYTSKTLVPNLGLGILGALVPQLDNNNFYLNPDAKNDIRNIFDFIFTGKGLDYENIKKYYFILESCEYKRQFLRLDLDYSAITNIELDHTDYYKDLEDYKSAFQSFVDRTKKKVFCLQDLNLKGDNITIINKKRLDFDFLIGEHNQDNGNLVLNIIKGLNPSLNTPQILDIMKSFQGLWRRMEFLFENKNGASIFSDYGHVASSLKLGHKALKSKYPDKKITCIFQPHQISRIVKGRNEFPQALKLYDNIVIYDIYAARESLDLLKDIGIKDLNSKADLGKIFAERGNGIYTEDFEDIKNLINSARQDEIIIVYSAGDIDFEIRKEYL